jgi:hypothetical protein
MNKKMCAKVRRLHRPVCFVKSARTRSAFMTCKLIICNSDLRIGPLGFWYIYRPTSQYENAIQYCTLSRQKRIRVKIRQQRMTSGMIIIIPYILLTLILDAPITSVDAAHCTLLQWAPNPNLWPSNYTKFDTSGGCRWWWWSTITILFL